MTVPDEPYIEPMSPRLAQVILKQLTKREIKVLEWIADGMDDQQIAVALGLSSWRSTVRIVGVIRDKMVARNRTHTLGQYLRAKYTVNGHGRI